MTALRCRTTDTAPAYPRFTPAPEPRTTLADGTEVSTWSPEWLIECRDRHAEALKVLSFGTREIRIEHLDRYEERLGKVARTRLEAEILRMWKLRQMPLPDA